MTVHKNHHHHTCHRCGQIKPYIVDTTLTGTIPVNHSQNVEISVTITLCSDCAYNAKGITREVYDIKQMSMILRGLYKSPLDKPENLGIMSHEDKNKET